MHESLQINNLENFTHLYLNCFHLILFLLKSFEEPEYTKFKENLHLIITQ